MLKPFLRVPVKEPKRKISTYKTFNYILYVPRTGIQCRRLKTCKNEIYWSNVYKWHNRWSKDGSCQRDYLSRRSNFYPRMESWIYRFYVERGFVLVIYYPNRGGVKDREKV